MRTIVTSCVAFALAGCAWLGFAPSHTVYATRVEALRVGAATLRDFEVPVAYEDALRGLVSSGRFEVEGSWGGESMARRVNCGESDGVPRAELGVVELQIELHVEPRQVRESEVPTARPGEAVFVGAGLGREASRVTVRSRGAVVTPDGERHSCRLTTEFAQRILREIALRTGGMLAAS